VPYTFQSYRDLARQTNSRLLLVIDAPRHEIYKGIAVAEAPEYVYNQLVQESSEKLEIPFLDLTETFLTDYAEKASWFSFVKDYHWNEYGHKLAGQTIAREIVQYSWLD
jgi:hypothetical protein